MKHINVENQTFFVFNRFKHIFFYLGTTTKPPKLLKTVQAGNTHLWDQVLEGVHDLGALGLLVVGEATSDDDDSRKHDTQVQL